MAFFRPPEDHEEPGRRHQGPPPAEWAHAPELVLPGILPERLRLADTAEGSLTLIELRAYPEGCWWELSAIVRAPDDWATASRAWNVLFGADRPVTAAGELPRELVRFGVRYRDGSSASTLTRVPAMRDDSRPPPEPPVLYARPTRAGVVYDSEWLQIGLGLWQWPLPPDGPFELLFEYPLIDVPETTLVLDGTRIRAAAADAIDLTPSATA